MYFYTNRHLPKNNIKGARILNFERKYAYRSVNKDFGPIDIGSITEYCREMEQLLKDIDHSAFRPGGEGPEVIIHYSSINPKVLANQALLICCFEMLCLHHPPEYLFKKFNPITRKLMAFCDTSKPVSDFELGFNEVIKALHTASYLQLYKYSIFSTKSYFEMNDPLDYDMTWIIPRQLLAFRSPSHFQCDGALKPVEYIGFFRNNNVKTVIRLNESNYYETVFENENIQVVDMRCAALGNPLEASVVNFIGLCK